ncbi:Lactose permease 27 [Colletotrichum musicola]|uniref:Lactose permease 27 n=1 Tax=Colletotrichum musicola TaxID=2175873 RepID=A0A8H6NBL4_9PEZI|nr:Lactose permease 27 [Colletotrichum musicola]
MAKPEGQTATSMANSAADDEAVPARSEVLRLMDLDTTPWYQKPNLRYLYLFLVPACIGVEMTTGYDGSILNGLQAVQAWQDYFGEPKGALLGILGAAYNLGGLFSLPFVPWFNDRFGRKHSITFGSAVLVVGAILQATSVHIGMFLAARLLLGLGIPFAVSGASQLIAELSHPRQRGVITGLFNASWSSGAILAAGVTLGHYHINGNQAWRVPSALQALPASLQLLSIWFIPESPRWLISKDRKEEAFRILVKYHGEGDDREAFVNAEFSEISAQVQLEMESSKRTWGELVSTSGNRRRMLIACCVGIFSQWSGNGLISKEICGTRYYLAKTLATIGITDRRTQNIMNLSLTCWNFLTGIAGSFATRLLRRRVQYLTAFASMAVIFAVWTGVGGHYAESGAAGTAETVIVMIFLYEAAYHLMQPLSYVFITEVFPFVLRAKGVATLQFFTRGSTAFNTFVNPIGLEDLGWKFYLVYAVWLWCETAIIYFLYPETKGPTLEELACLFDDDKPAAVQIKRADDV